MSLPRTAQGTRRTWPDPITTPPQQAEPVPWKNLKQHLTTRPARPKVIYMENGTPKTFTKTAAQKRIRELARQQWRTTRGRRIEIQQLNGWTDSLKNLPNTCRAHNAEFRVMLSTMSRDAELLDMFRMNLGTDTTPAYVVK